MTLTSMVISFQLLYSYCLSTTAHTWVYTEGTTPPPHSSGSLVKYCGPRCGQADPWRKTHENERTHIIRGGGTSWTSSRTLKITASCLIPMSPLYWAADYTTWQLWAHSACKWLERRVLTFDHQKNAREWGNVSWHLFIPFPFPCLSCWILWHWQIPVPFSTQLRPIARLFHTSSPLRVPMETHWQAPMWFRARWDLPSWLLS